MFDRIAPRYDLLNDIISLGLDRWWRRSAARALHVEPGSRVLDLGCGTGKLGALLARRGCEVVGVDVSSEMLSRARRGSGSGGQRFVLASAFHLPFPHAAFQGAASGFVLRNLRDLPAAFAELARVLAPGSRIAMVDLTEPPNRAVRWGFDAYFGTVAPALGRVAGQGEAYRYLVRSLGQIPPAPRVRAMLADAGFVASAVRPLTAGTATLFTATRSG